MTMIEKIIVLVVFAPIWLLAAIIFSGVIAIIWPVLLFVWLVKLVL